MSGRTERDSEDRKTGERTEREMLRQTKELTGKASVSGFAEERKGRGRGRGEEKTKEGKTLRP